MLLTQLLQEGPAETTGYMIAGYAVIFGVMLIYVASLYIRRRNLIQDLEVLQELQEDE
ncbi:MAG: hypothetical protein KAS38_20155 [Anaerolineales bacterium]|nr:hypothetical protein [Anaerolineales bacterium]